MLPIDLISPNSAPIANLTCLPLSAFLFIFRLKHIDVAKLNNDSTQIKFAEYKLDLLVAA
ncbi:hypothetical protein CO666_19585 [Rhizobium chutanense]|uniref:Uncharacterized protein n=1 Tax=Rhizobium chutanense TaxID=2035448 RepID=A0A2A6J8B0_9HYPH|nr:hypothetical protein CO666_19585 [Rhizobium chutanense]